MKPGYLIFSSFFHISSTHSSVVMGSHNMAWRFVLILACTASITGRASGRETGREQQ
jgi:hypothetical protein